MGYLSEYIDKKLTFEQLAIERKLQLKSISRLRGGRDVLVLASDYRKPQFPISIDYSDIHSFQDQVSNLAGDQIDLIVETPGGSGEVAEDLVRIIRHRYTAVGVIIPGWVKSAGTIMAMSADEILMDSVSSLGPIDAQLTWQGKVFSADALLKGFQKVKSEVQSTGLLNKAYIPILQAVSLGELEHAENAQQFASTLVKDWLVRYKFAKWDKHSSTQLPVTIEEKSNVQQRLPESSATMSTGALMDVQ